jgi:hypothetical protein
MRFYQASEAVTAEVEQLAMKSRARPWWRDYSDIFDNEFPGFEADATRIRVFTPLVIPGLFQTAEYIEALMRSSGKPPAWRRRASEARAKRQRILDRDKTTVPQVDAVIAEASLMYRWGSRSERRDQITHLIDLGERPNVRLHLQRFVDGPPPGMFSAVQIFDYAGEPSLVFTETDHGIQEVGDAEYVRGYIDSFDRAVDMALEAADTVVYLRQFEERLE